MSNLLEKASIITTPTAYSDGKLHSVKPVQTLGNELVTNGDFATDSDWGLSSGSSIANGQLTIDALDGSFQSAQQLLSTTVGKIYKLQFEITSINSGGKIQFIHNNSVIGLLNYTSVGTHTFYFTSTNSSSFLQVKRFFPSNTNATIDNVSVKQVIDADFDFQRGSAATRVNSQGLVENVQILSGNLVQNGDFSEIGSELVTNGGFDTDSDWNLGQGQWTISNGFAVADNANNNLHTNLPVASAVGLQHKITFTLQDVTQGYVKVGLSNINPTQFNSDGTYTLYIKSTGNRFLYFDPTGFTGKLTNVSVKEVGQNWEFGTGWSMRDGKAVSDGSANNSIKQVISFNPSVLKIKFDVSDLTQGSVRLFVNTPTFTQLINAGSNGSYETTVEVTSGANNIFFYSTNNFIGSIDNVSVVEITDDTDLPRIDYTDGCGSLLLEPQSTNLLPYSEDFSDSSWIKISTNVVADAAISPSGLINGYKVVSNSAQAEHNIRRTILPAATESMSIFAKKAEWKYLFYRLNLSGVWYNTIFDLEDGVVTLNESGSEYSIEDYGNGWYRCVLNIANRSHNLVQFGISENSYSHISQGDGTSGLYIWGAMLEQNDFSTSYIPTNGSTATRLADVCNNAGSSDLINSTEGVLYAEIAALANSGNYRSISLSDGTNTNRVNLTYSTASNVLLGFINANGVNTSFSFTVNPITNSIKCAIKYKDDDCSFWVNGTEISNSTSQIAFPINTLTKLSFTSGSSSSNFFGKVKSVVVFKEALTNDELEGLTGEGYDTFNALALANNYTII